jgi:hypothetical protein
MVLGRLLEAEPGKKSTGYVKTTQKMDASVLESAMEREREHQNSKNLLRIVAYDLVNLV